MSTSLYVAAAISAVASVALAWTSFERPPVQTEQRGFRGVGLVENYNPRIEAVKKTANKAPDKIDPQEKSGTKSSELYENVKVLGDLDSNEFLRLMQAITEWVSPEQGCTYCHAEGNLADDSVYTKVVARRMLQMTQAINASWKPHVAETGVTCYTCHRGQPVPANIWFNDAGPRQALGMAGSRDGQNLAAKSVGYASLPADPFTPFLEKDNSIRVIAGTALPSGSKNNIKQTEWTYGLMMHFSQALGVNCTYCHNSRSFTDWDQSPKQRTTAWHGIRMVRDLNVAYLDPLKPNFPANRLGPTGDAPKLNCLTCHQGVSKPLYGVSMVGDFPELTTAPK